MNVFFQVTLNIWLIRVSNKFALYGHQKNCKCLVKYGCAMYTLVCFYDLIVYSLRRVFAKIQPFISAFLPRLVIYLLGQYVEINSDEFHSLLNLLFNYRLFTFENEMRNYEFVKVLSA